MLQEENMIVLQMCIHDMKIKEKFMQYNGSGEEIQYVV